MSKKLTADRTLLKAGELAKRAGVLVTTIRYYTKIGLLQSDAVSPGKYNLYDEQNALARLSQIEDLKNRRYTLDEIKQELGQG